MRVNRQIRVPKVRLIDQDGNQVGVVNLQEAQKMAEDAGLDLVEVVPTSTPPVCKIIDYGKFSYDQSKKKKQSKKATHQIKVKEIKLKVNIADHDFETKLRHARGFIEEGNKVRITCVFRGREMARPEIGEELIERMCKGLEDIATAEAPAKRMGRTLSTVIAPGARKKRPSEE